MVARFAPAAITLVFIPVAITTNSTSNIVNTVLNICSNVCALAVTDIFCLPLKYPLNTEAIVTKNIAGESATKVSSDSGICKITFEIYPAPINNIKVPY